MFEVAAMVGLAAASALWRMAFNQGDMQRGMSAILQEVKQLREQLAGQIGEISEQIHDQEQRIRSLERSRDSLRQRCR